MALINVRKGSTTTMSVTSPTLLKMEHALITGAMHLETKTSEAVMKDAFYATSSDVLLKVFGETTAATVASRVANQIWPDAPSGTKENIASLARSAAKKMGDIHANANGGTVSLTVTYQEFYNITTGRTILKYITSVS